MGLLNIFFKQKRTKIGNIQVDATIKEKHIAKSIISENPIEQGSDVTDNVKLKNLRYQMDGMITNSPSAFSLIDTNNGIITSFFGNTDRAKDAYDQFMKLREDKTLTVIETGLRKYDDMLIEDFTIDRDASTANAIFFTAVLVQVKIVSSSSVPQENLKSNARRGASTKNVGTKTTDQIPDNEPLSSSPSSKTSVSDLQTLADKLKESFQSVF